MIKTEFDPSRIRKCEIITINNKQMIQFIGLGDRHKMMKNEDGSIEVIKLPEQGNEYRYGAPYTIEDGISILMETNKKEHQTLAEQIKKHISSS